MKYCNNEKLEDLIIKSIESIKNEEEPNLEKFLKKPYTGILSASKEHEKKRYIPGNKLVTYNGIDEEGNPIQETWGGGVADINEDSVILKNLEPIKYPEGHELEGLVVKGTYNQDGTFKVDQKNGDEKLFNEYVSDVEFVKNAYGIKPKTKWQKGLKLQPSYALEIPSEMKDIKIKTGDGIEINLNGGDYIIIDAKDGEVKSIHGIEKDWFDKTYVSMEEHVKKLDK